MGSTPNQSCKTRGMAHNHAVSLTALVMVIAMVMPLLRLQADDDPLRSAALTKVTSSRAILRRLVAEPALIHFALMARATHPFLNHLPRRTLAWRSTTMMTKTRLRRPPPLRLPSTAPPRQTRPWQQQQQTDTVFPPDPFTTMPPFNQPRKLMMLSRSPS